MFSDPQTIIGVLIGIVIIAGGTYIGVSAQRKRDRRDADGTRP
jgi:hypothetical protein